LKFRPVPDRSRYVGPLRSLVPATQEQHDAAVGDGVIDSIAGAVVDPQLVDTLAQRFHIAEQSERQSVNAHCDALLRLSIAQCVEPLAENVRSVGSAEVPDFVSSHCNLKVTGGQPGWLTRLLLHEAQCPRVAGDCDPADDGDMFFAALITAAMSSRTRGYLMPNLSIR
jgi:hypothetical protein